MRVPLPRLIASDGVDLRSFFAIAARLCTIVDDLHRRQIIHGAITSYAVGADPQTGDVELLLADAAARTPMAPAADRGAEFMSPEQTGRMNRSVDYRTDLYSLGVVFYVALTGSLPFASSDPLELMHGHIARPPTPPALVKPEVPEQVSRIVLKLLAKAAEDRYQSAQGLKLDLQRCLQEWTATGTIEPFALGQHDLSDRLLVSQKLYGRDRELADLLQAFDDTCDGRTTLLLVAGYSGIGKTSLIQELYKPIVRERGYFIAGKFDQVVRDIPYGAFTQALRSLVRQLLTESEARLAQWRTEISAALGGNGGVLAEVIPEIELILGPQAAPPPLDPTEAKNRFSYVFQSFVGAVAQQEHPLVVFLDDLQWVDSATLDLLHALLTSTGIHHLLLIGAYRDNEVDARHVLTWAINRLEQAGARMPRLALGPLTLRDLTAFLHDTLRRDAGYVEPLARLIQVKTDGNPFFVIQFLKTLAQEGLLTFDYEHAGWSFSLEAIAAAGITDNVVDLMTRKIQRLSLNAQRVMTLAACIGNPFDWSTFLTVNRQSRDEAEAGLTEALEAGLVHRADDHGDLYFFLHDRVRQAAYGLIPDADKTPVHLDVGRLLLAGVEAEAGDDRIFTIVNHLNIGRHLISDRAERLAVAGLNLAAGRKAKVSSAYHVAVDHFVKGIELLAPGDWHTEYGLMWSLHVEAAECRYLAGAFDLAESSLRLLLEQAASARDRALVHSLRMTLYENQSRWADAVSAGRDGLALFGISFPALRGENEAALDRELNAVQQLLGNRTIASLIELPDMTDADIQIVMRSLTILWAPAYISGDDVLARLISATMVKLSLIYGHTEDSAYGYVTHAITIGPIRRDYQAAYAWGVLALQVNRRFDDVKRRAKIHQQFQAHVNLWCRPFETCMEHAREAARSGLEAGDFTYAGYGAATEAWAAWLISRSLDRFVRDFTPTLDLLERIKMTDFMAAHRLVLNWARALQGQTSHRLSLSSSTFDEQQFAATYERDAPFFLTFLYSARLQLAVLFDEPHQALLAGERARAVAVAGTIWPVFIDFWNALAMAAAFGAVSPGEQAVFRRELQRVYDQLRELAESCAENFRCFFLLIAAERERLSAQHERATTLCEDAIAYARATNNVQQEAIANELCAKVWLERGEQDAARPFLSEAYRCYDLWGARAKLAHLDERHGDLLPTPRPLGISAGTVAEARGDAAAHVDMSTVLKVARAVAVELEIGELLKKLMQLALENAGASRGVFLQERAGTLVVAAEATADADTVTIGPPVPVDQVDDVAVTVVRYVRRTGQDVVVSNAATDERFSGDRHIVRSGVRSILCVPVGHQGRLGGILYLENNFTTDAFTPNRIEVMRILAAQTAISLDNAQLYEDMKSEVQRRTSAELALREALREIEALKNRLEAENVYLQEEIRTQHNFNEIVGNSPALLEALRKVERVAPIDSTVLIVGETGSGKELFARAVHSRSRRSERPLVKVNCGAIAPGLVESELFGHVKGAFTGAIERRVGRFELAHGGTIFLDEVGELPADAQVKLLRVLQEQEFEPVGSSRTVRVSVRVIVATNRDLDQAVRDGRFRADLLYRLNVFPIDVPPLRHRTADIPLLVGFFAAGLSRRLGKPIQGFSARSMERMLAYAWPGNVRELQNIVERAAILASGPVLELSGTILGEAGPARSPASTKDELATARAESLNDVQRLHILSVLQSTGGVVEGAKGAATILGLHPNTLRSRMKKLGIRSAN